MSHKRTTKTTRALRTLAAAGAAIALSGCFVGPAQKAAGRIRGDHRMEQPAGIAPGANGLRESPCVCIEIETGALGRVKV